MKRFTDAGRRAIADSNLYVALQSALTLPDICGSLESPNSNYADRYIGWCRKWLISSFTTPDPRGGEPLVFLSAENCYRLRGALIHDGRTAIHAKEDGKRFDFEFCDQTYTSQLNKVYNEAQIAGKTVIVDDYLQIKADLFSAAMFKAVDEWDRSVANDPAIQQEKTKLLYIRSRFDAPRSRIGVYIGPGPDPREKI